MFTFKDVVVDVETPDRHLLKGRKVCALKYRTPMDRTNLKCRVEIGLTTDNHGRRFPYQESESSDNEYDNNGDSDLYYYYY